MNTKIIFLVLGLCVVSFKFEILAQCTPPSADNCDDANVLCSLTEVNGYCCTNTDYSNPTGCTPLCPSGGAPHNTGWWAFVTQGGAVSINISFSNCSINGTGVQMGIWGDCSCSESIVCNPACNSSGSFTLSGNLQACKTYYLFVDGCNGDVCDFCLSTSGGGPPTLPPLQPIQGPKDVCVGACKIRYSVNIGGACDPPYEWSLDGNEVGSGLGEVLLDFPEAGDFVLCVTAFIGNPQSGSICDQKGPICSTIKVRKGTDRLGPVFNLCPANIPYNWHDILVTHSGVYRQSFIDSIYCCKYDSVIEFRVLQGLEQPVVRYIGCDTFDFYRDTIASIKYNSCKINETVRLKIQYHSEQCDSSYKLNAAFLNFKFTIDTSCDQTGLYYKAIIFDSTQNCFDSLKLVRNSKFKWYNNLDPKKTILDSQDVLKVKLKGNYCFDFELNAYLENYAKKCVFTFCENFDESEILPAKICPTGNFLVNNGDTSSIWIDQEIKKGFFRQEWSVTGGTIVTRMNGLDTNAIQVAWDKNAQTGRVCYQYLTHCGFSMLCCQNVYFTTSTTTNFINPELVQIIPNPMNYNFRMRLGIEFKIKSMQLYDLRGRTVRKWTQNFTDEFDVSSFTSGIYHLCIHTEFGNIHKKIIVFK